MGRTDVCGAGNGLLKPPVKMAFVDRLKPKCSYANNTEAWNKVQHSKPGAIAKMSKNNSRSPTQHRAKAIIKKYKRQVRMTEFKRLKSIVPAIAENDEATEEVILEETIKYIDDLHQQLLERIHCHGLPSQMRNASEDHEGADPSNMNLDEMKELLQKSIQPQLEARQKIRRHQESIRLKKFIEQSHIQVPDRKR